MLLNLQTKGLLCILAWIQAQIHMKNHVDENDIQRVSQINFQWKSCMTLHSMLSLLPRLDSIYYFTRKSSNDHLLATSRRNNRMSFKIYREILLCFFILTTRYLLWVCCCLHYHPEMTFQHHKGSNIETCSIPIHCLIEYSEQTFFNRAFGFTTSCSLQHEHIFAMHLSKYYEFRIQFNSQYNTLTETS